jgi:hypothetical protein
LKLGNGDTYWYVNDKRHRINGPAIELINGDTEWYINGIKYTEEQFNEIVNFPNLAVPYIKEKDSIYHIKFKEDVGIRLSYVLELYVDGVFIEYEEYLRQIILQFLQKSNYVEPMLDWIQENSNYFPSQFTKRLFY